MSRQKDLPNASIRSTRAVSRVAIIAPLLVVLSSAGCGALPTSQPSHVAPPSHAADAETGTSERAPSGDRDSAPGHRSPALEQRAVDRGVALPEAVDRDVLPDCAPVFRALDGLVSEDVAVRRSAARELATLAQLHPIGRLAAARLASVALVETDQLVWESVLDAIANDPGEPASRLACAAIRHPSPEVRRRACDHLARHRAFDPDHATLLLDALQDENPSVVRAAVRALAAPGRIDDTAPIQRLLLATDELVRLEAATALCRLGDPSGPAALERLSYSANHTVRREVARGMGEIGDPSLAPSLVRLLDDRHDVRTAALEALPKVVGHDVADPSSGSPPSFAQRVEAWKRWHRHEHDTARK